MKSTFLLLTSFILAWQKEAFTESLHNGSELEAPYGNSSSSNQHNITSSDSHFPLDSARYAFKKCCPSHEILSNKGCVSKGADYVPSKTMTRLTETHFPQTSWPESADGKNCSTMLKTRENSTHWVVTDDGYLTVGSTYGDQTVSFYCVEDYIEMTGATETVAVLCLRDVAHILSTTLVDRFSKGHHVGKCCPRKTYISHQNGSYSCVSDTLELDIVKTEEFVAANITEVEEADFPVCSYNVPIKYFHFGHLSNSVYSSFDEDRIMTIFYVEENSLENVCVREKVPINIAEYCIDHVVDNTTDIQVFVCADFESKLVKHQEKFLVLPVLLGFSCAALLATVLFLVTARVRRELYTVRKINTLAGRILLAYVMSYLLAFLILIINQTLVLDERTCIPLGGALLFFSLAAFLWNTSISMEALVLTVDIRMSESFRFLCYCLCAWGVAGIITAVALTLGYYRPSLPCSVITPRFGVKECFFSDPRAKLVYLYLPMCISLCANILFLAASKLVRRAKIRQLEQGLRPQNNSETQTSQSRDAGTDQKPKPGKAERQCSGLRKYENRSVFSDSVKLVFWAGLTWISEVASFLYDYYVGVSEEWYSYLLYIPTALNTLRGVGIFWIIVLAPEYRKRIYKKVASLCPWVASLGKKRQSRSTTSPAPSDTYATSQYKTPSTGETEDTVTKL
ncbi:probable G-protein coupled receptor Mth-like 3 [Macrobrachium rosenbergii]|uniref:probable G-protein coupled receptor Mth-like 3 n=1 Tax=Macrobrachium rosenbergii TaxID=79674 RepID=UPI0034D56FFC